MLPSRVSDAAEALPGNAQITGKIRYRDLVQMIWLLQNETFVPRFGCYGQRLDYTILQYGRVPGKKEVNSGQVFFRTQLLLQIFPSAHQNVTITYGNYRKICFRLTDQRSGISVHIPRESEPQDHLTFVQFTDSFKNAALDVKKEIEQRIWRHHTTGFFNMSGDAYLFQRC